MKTYLLILLLAVSVPFFQGCASINSALGIRQDDTPTDVVYKYQNTYNIILSVVITARQNKAVSDQDYNRFLESKRVAWKAIQDLKLEAAQAEKDGKPLDQTSIAYRAVNAALTELSVFKVKYQPEGKGTTNGTVSIGRTFVDSDHSTSSDRFSFYPAERTSGGIGRKG